MKPIREEDSHIENSPFLSTFHKINEYKNSKLDSTKSYLWWILLVKMYAKIILEINKNEKSEDRPGTVKKADSGRKKKEYTKKLIKRKRRKQ